MAWTAARHADKWGHLDPISEPNFSLENMYRKEIGGGGGGWRDMMHKHWNDIKLTHNCEQADMLFGSLRW